MAEDILTQEQLSLDILMPLIQETTNKIITHPAKNMQTGPAKRNDQQTIQQHLEFLKKYPQYQSVYQLLSNSIIRFFN
jgi:predicted short-subunit dehydrogenase-like oxidoreductase (DUF2520 family)